MNLHDMRLQYMQSTLEIENVLNDPIAQFKKWFEEIQVIESIEPNAMTLATCADNKPSARIVLLKEIQENGFVFFTNYLSKKGMNIKANPHGSLVFFWKELERQVRVEGRIEKISENSSDSYFYSRPVSSQIGAIVSPQSQVIESSEVLLKKYKMYEDSIEKIERPSHWGGYVLIADSIEFWQGRPSRLHDRILYTKQKDEWTKVRLAP